MIFGSYIVFKCNNVRYVRGTCMGHYVNSKMYLSILIKNKKILTCVSYYIYCGRTSYWYIDFPQPASKSFFYAMVKSRLCHTKRAMGSKYRKHSRVLIFHMYRSLLYLLSILDVHHSQNQPCASLLWVGYTLNDFLFNVFLNIHICRATELTKCFHIIRLPKFEDILHGHWTGMISQQPWSRF